MIKILVFGITQNPGGVENVIMNYYRRINKDKIQFDFLCNTEEVAYEDEILKIGGKIYRITARSVDRRKYKKELEKFYQAHAGEYNAIWVNVCSLANIDYLKMAKKYNIKYRIIHSHNSENMDSKLRGILHKINKRFIKRYATDFWACSDEAGRWFFSSQIMNSDSYLVINNAIDTDKYKFNEEVRTQYRKELNIENQFVIGNVGRLHFQKNQEFLIDIFNEINQKIDNVRLLIIGQGEDEGKLKDKVTQLNLEDKVQFLGVRYDIPNLLQSMDVFVFPSVFEGLGLALIEAQASGLQTYASKDVIPSVVKMSNDFQFISLNDKPEEWAKIILENRKNRNKNEEAYINIKKSGYDIQEQTRKIEKYFVRD